MDTTKTVTHISLCAGYGGIDLGLRRAIPSLRTIAFSEIEAFACANLVAKIEAGCLDAAPIWTDVKTFPWAKFRGLVDILSGGYPCQPFSAAGKRLGKDDPRHLWPWIADGIRLCRPSLCFFENVEGHISLGLREVIGELEEIGYRTTWGVFSAAEVGAPHQRKRVFILAHRNDEGLQRWFSHDVPECAGKSFAGKSGASVADAKLPVASRLKQYSGQPSLSQEAIRFDCGGEDSSWPSRPGQPQFAWEPARVVGAQSADLGDAEGERTGGLPIGAIKGQSRFEGPSSDSAIVADAYRKQSQRGRNAGELEQASGTEQSETQERQRSWDAVGDQSSAGAIVADAERVRRTEAGRDAGAMGQEKRRQESNQPQFGNFASSFDCCGSIVANARSEEPTWISQPEGRDESVEAGIAGESIVSIGQAEPALGGDADGAAGGMDYAELCVSGDNRTDELRLLGNGVVPATAERAFRVLSARFTA